jgi:hypothetical protein
VPIAQIGERRPGKFDAVRREHAVEKQHRFLRQVRDLEILEVERPWLSRG